MAATGKNKYLDDDSESPTRALYQEYSSPRKRTTPKSSPEHSVFAINNDGYKDTPHRYWETELRVSGLPTSLVQIFVYVWNITEWNRLVCEIINSGYLTIANSLSLSFQIKPVVPFYGIWNPQPGNWCLVGSTGHSLLTLLIRSQMLTGVIFRYLSRPIIHFSKVTSVPLLHHWYF